jgi:hypothetical protein
MNAFNIVKAFEDKKKRGWHTLYVAVDLHGTLIKPYHDCIEFYPGAIEVMRWFNSRPDFKVILWTSSYLVDIEKFQRACEKEGISFNFINGNPLEKSNGRAFFGQKFYFNILLDDKAGFVGDTDWHLVRATLDSIGEWSRIENNKNMKRAIYTGEPIETSLGHFLGYGSTGYVKQVGNNTVFVPDSSPNVHFAVQPKDVYLASA